MSNPTAHRLFNLLPPAAYQDIRLPDGTHSGVRIDCARGILEIQRRGVKHYYDLVLMQPVEMTIDTDRELCYTR